MHSQIDVPKKITAALANGGDRRSCAAVGGVAGALGQGCAVTGARILDLDDGLKVLPIIIAGAFGPAIGARHRGGGWLGGFLLAARRLEHHDIFSRA